MQIQDKPVTIASTGQSPSVQGARERAITRLMGNSSNQAQELPVANPNQVAPEDLTAIASKSELRQSNNIESTVGSTEPPKVEAPKTDALKEEPLSPQYAQLARKEKALRDKYQELKTQEADLKAREDAIKSPSTPSIDQSKYISIDELKKDPFSLLNQHGMGYDWLTEKALNSPSAESLAYQQQIESLQSEIKSIRTDQETSKKSMVEQQQQAYQQAVAQLKSETNRLIDSDESFEMIKATGSIDDVVELIEETFKREKYVMPVQEACKQVEKYLEEEAYKLANLKKIQSRLKPAEAPKQEIPGALTQQPALTKTLSNAMGSAKPLSAKERAIAAFNGKLK